MKQSNSIFGTRASKKSVGRFMKSRRTPDGPDQIPISFVKLLCPFILPHLCHLFNEIIQTKSIPSNWKKPTVTPIPKQPNPTEPEHFQPISVLPAVSKILEKILLVQIAEHLDNPNAQLLARQQLGYRRIGRGLVRRLLLPRSFTTCTKTWTTTGARRQLYRGSASPSAVKQFRCPTRWSTLA